MAKATSSVHAVDEQLPPFGSRFLTADKDVWSHSAWDHVPPPDDQDDVIAASLERQRLNPVAPDAKLKFNAKPSKYWNEFYKTQKDKFFKDRKWLRNEFPALTQVLEPYAGAKTVLEIGCGAGNGAFPLLAENKNTQLHLVACDYAPKAVEVVQSNPLYLSPPIGKMTASVWDLTSQDSLPDGVTPNSVDIIIMVFVLSALSPAEWNYAIQNIHTMLKPGGMVLLRDYGRHDLTQLRFKNGRMLDENFYIRGDGTRVYFFEIDDLAKLFTGRLAPRDQVTLTESIEAEDGDGVPSTTTTISPEDLHIDRAPPSPPPNLDPALFSIIQLGVDRRLLVNRKRQLKMYRVWMQGQFCKL